jgi:hypothetical protein
MKVEEIHLALEKNKAVNICLGLAQDLEADIKNILSQENESDKFLKQAENSISQTKKNMIAVSSNIVSAIKKADDLGVDTSVFNSMKKVTDDFIKRMDSRYNRILQAYK